VNTKTLPTLKALSGRSFSSDVYGATLDIQACSDLLNLSVERIGELVECGYIPHLYIDGNGPLFRPSDIRRWAKAYLIYAVEARPMPVTFICQFRENPKGVIPYALEPMRDKMFSSLPLGERCSAVYFLILDNEVVYVGQTVSLVSRLGKHSEEKTGKWDSFLYIPCPEELLTKVEKWWISKLRPQLNTVEHEWNPMHHLSARLPQELVMELTQ